MLQGDQKQIGDYAYNTNSVLGQGAFGSVYKGWHVQTKEPVAIKQMSKNNPNTIPSMIAQEVKTMKAFQSPHIVQIYEFYETGNNLYIVLEFCEGGDLEHYLKKQPNKQLAESEACKVMRDILKGFKAMHDKQFVHRDIKPANILVGKGQYKLGDLGLARSIQNQSMLQSICGTPLYMSPQILMNQQYTDKADIWSLGLMFYEMLFNKYPWTIRNMYAMQKAIMTEPLRFPYEKPINKQTKDFIRKCLKVNETERISWCEIFEHPLYKEEEQQRIQRKPSIDFQYNYGFDQKTKQTIQDLQALVARQPDPDAFIQKIFHNFDQDRCGNLNKQEFISFLKVLNKNFSTQSAEAIFIKIDADGNQSISLQEFRVLFNEYDFSDLNDENGQIIKEIRAIVEAKQMSLQRLFDKYNTTRTGTLGKQEFSKFIREIGQGFTTDEIEQLFKQFDHDGDGQITFDEFYKTIRSQPSDQTPKQQNQVQQQQGFQRQCTYEDQNSIEVKYRSLQSDYYQLKSENSNLRSQLSNANNEIARLQRQLQQQQQQQQSPPQYYQNNGSGAHYHGGHYDNHHQNGGHHRGHYN